MRNLVLIGSLCAFAFQVNAEEKDLKTVYTTITDAINSAIFTRKGSNELGGSFAYNADKTEYTSGNTLTEQTLNVEFGYGRFILNNLSLGILFSYMHQSITNDIADKKVSMKQTLIGPTIKKYFGNRRSRPFVFTNVLFLQGDLFDAKEADLGIGLLYHLSGNTGITAYVKYGKLFTSDEIIKNQNRLLLGVGLTNFIL